MDINYQCTLYGISITPEHLYTIYPTSNNTPGGTVLSHAPGKDPRISELEGLYSKLMDIEIP